MKNKALILLLMPILIFAVDSGCKKKLTELSPDIVNSDEALYKYGEQFIKKDPEKARLYFHQVIDSFPKSFYAQRAKLAIADSYFNQRDEGSLLLAASEYREFIQLFPFSPSAPYAQYQVGMTFFKKALKPGRDQTKTQQALAEFKQVVTKYPLSEEANDARDKIRECEERLAEHTFSIGHYYYKIRSYRAARSRLNEILTNYIEYSKMNKVYFYLGDSYFKEGKFDESIPYFTKLITDYPQSKLAEDAQKRLEEIERRKNPAV